MGEPSGDLAALFGMERARLNELLGTLEPGDWQRPSPCPGWTVLGLCCHLLGDDLGLLSRQRDGYHGTPSPDGLGEAGSWPGWMTCRRSGSGLSLTTEQAWRLLTNNLPTAEWSWLTTAGDSAITAVLLSTRAIIGSPK